MISELKPDGPRCAGLTFAPTTPVSLMTQRSPGLTTPESPPRVMILIWLLCLGPLMFSPTADAADARCVGETAGHRMPNFVYVNESTAPVAVLIELVGGSGKLRVNTGFAAVDFGDSDQFVSNAGTLPYEGWHLINVSSDFSGSSINSITFGSTDFLVRRRDDFVRAGFHMALVAIPGYLQGCPNGLWGHRRTERHLQDIRAVIARLRQSYPDLPIWLIGASRGSVSAVYVASRWTPQQGGPDGLVLLSPVTQNHDPGSPFPTVLQTRLETIRIPTLIVMNTGDNCSASPPQETYRISRRLVSAPRVEVRRVTGGRSRSADACGSLTRHDFDGVEEQVLKAVTHWIH